MAAAAWEVGDSSEFLCEATGGGGGKGSGGGLLEAPVLLTFPLFLFSKKGIETVKFNKTDTLTLNSSCGIN